MPSDGSFMLCASLSRNGEKTVLNPNGTGTTTEGYLADLVYELLDAHADTIRLTGESPLETEWAAHVDYLRGLQRVGREALARLAT
jgi:hypothetical protein